VVHFRLILNFVRQMRDRTDEIRAVVKGYDKLDFISLRIEDAFNDDWWEGIGGQPPKKDLGVDATNEGQFTSDMVASWADYSLVFMLDLFLSALPGAASNRSPVSRLRRYISSLPTQTAILNAIQTLTRLLLLHTALSTGSSHLLLGTSLTSLSISLISSISQGGGFVVKEEAQEEWAPRVSANSRQVNGHKNGSIRVIRPLRDIGMKECAIWARWSGLTVVGHDRSSGGKQSIGALTKGKRSFRSMHGLSSKIYILQSS
jgi:cytoplasmic tRNA 2-thiolation protein 2